MPQLQGVGEIAGSKVFAWRWRRPRAGEGRVQLPPHGNKTGVRLLVPRLTGQVSAERVEAWE